jgi:hypothetical protein
MSGWAWINPETAARGEGGTMHYIDEDGRALCLARNPGANTLDAPDVCPVCAKAAVDFDVMRDDPPNRFPDEWGR